MLQGTFDTLSLTEVLGLLAQSHKTGALWLKAGSVEGRVYLADGRCCAAESGDLAEPVETNGELGTRLVDVCFALARQPEGSFRFVADDEPAWRVGGGGVVVDEAVDALDRLLEEWREIQLVIPSLEVRPRLAAELGTDSIIVDQPRWRLLVCLDGNRSVRDVMQHTQRSVLDVCNALKELIEEGAVEIASDAPSAPDEVIDEPVDVDIELHPSALVPEPEPEPEPQPQASEPIQTVEERAAVLLASTDVEPTAAMPDPFAGAEEETPEERTEETFEETPEDVVTGADAGTVPESVFEDGDGRDRGALLRLFSALRET